MLGRRYRFRVSMILSGGLMSLALLGLMAGTPAAAEQAQSGAKRLETAAPGDCADCHADQKVLPAEHVQTKDLAGDKCAECHRPGETSLRTKMPLSHHHQLNGVGCADCHDEPAAAKPVGTEKCLSCHGSAAQVAEATAKLEYNPHDSPHYGPDLDCELCHHQHARSENFCAQCHDWKLIVP